MNIDRAARWDIHIQQGSTFLRTLDFGEDVDLSSFSFRGQIRRAHADPAVLGELAVTALSERLVEVRLTPEQSAALPAGRLVYDIEMHTADDAWVARILEGSANVTPEVTR